jgi:hypothetical protein
MAQATGVAPPGLRGHSAVVSWGETRVQRRQGAPNFHEVAADMKVRLYFSTEGRLFGSLSLQVNGRSGGVEQLVGEKNALRPWAANFERGSMNFFLPLADRSAIRRIAMTFDAGLQSCAATVTLAKQAGTQIMRAISPITHEVIELQSIAPGAATCVLQDGNIFDAK